MEFGLVLPNAGDLAYSEAIIEIAEHAEHLGFTALWTSDHLVLPAKSDSTSPYAKRLPDTDLPLIDPMIALTAAAARTQRIKLGTSVYLSSLRHPIVAARLIASLDRISNGRVLLGVGAGWIPEEYQTMGIEFAERGRVLDEHIQALRALFEQNRPSFNGEHFQLGNMGFQPKPVQSPFPIWIGGNTVAARKRVARHGDGWHVIDVPVEELKVGINDLQARCKENGRNLDDVVVSTRSRIHVTDGDVNPEGLSAPLIGPRDKIFDELAQLREAGVQHVGLWPARVKLSLDGYLERMEELANEIVKPLS